MRCQLELSGHRELLELAHARSECTYVAVEPSQMDAYVDEQVFRYNTRRDSDSKRFTKVLSQLASKRLTYAELTGKEEGATAA